MTFTGKRLFQQYLPKSDAIPVLKISPDLPFFIHCFDPGRSRAPGPPKDSLERPAVHI